MNRNIYMYVSAWLIFYLLEYVVKKKKICGRNYLISNKKLFFGKRSLHICSVIKHILFFKSCVEFQCPLILEMV